MNKSTKQTLLSLSLIAALASCGQQESAQEYIEKAKTAIAEGKYNSSVVSLKNSIQAEPSNGEARYLLGKVYLKLDSSLNAIKELERAKANKYSLDKVLPLLANAYYLNEDFPSLVELNDKTLSEPAKLKVNFYQGLAHVQLEQLKEAKQLFNSLRRIADTDAEGYRLLLDSYIAYQAQDIEKAKQTVEEGLTKLPAQPQGVLLLGHIGSADSDYKLAIESYKKYINLQPNQRSVELMLANVLLQDGQFEQAESHADNILSLIPNQAFANYIKAMTRVQAADYENASKHAELALSNKINQPNLKLVAGVSAFYLKNYEQALYHLKPLVDYLPEDHFGRKMLVVSQMELGLVEDAADMVGSLANAATKGDEDFYSALSYRLLQAGAADEARELIAKQGVANDEDAKQLLKDGMLRMMLGEEAAMQSLEKAVELDPKLVKAELALAYLAVKSGDIKKAQDIAQKWQKQYPEKADGFNLESAIALQRKDTQLANSLLLKSLELEPENVYALTQLARIAVANNEDEQARTYLLKAIDVSPDISQLLRIYFDAFKNEQSLNFVAEKVQATPNNQSLQLVYAEALFKFGQVKQGLQQLNDIEPTAETPKLFWMLKVYGAKNSQNKIMLKSTLDQWRQISPYHLEHNVYLAEYYVADKNADLALKTINEGLEKHQNNLALSLIKTQLLLDTNQAKAAESFYQSYKAKVAELPVRFGIEGRIALANKEFGLAVQHLDTFYKSQPNNRNIMFLAGALVANKQPTEAVSIIEQHLAQHGGQAQLYSLLGSLQLEMGRRDKALIVYEQLAQHQPNNVIAINNVAWLYMEDGHLEKALKFAEKAVQLAPEIANVVDTYGQILMKSGQSREALTHAKKAYELSNGKDVDIALNYAQVLITNKRNNLASKVLSEVSGENQTQAKRKQVLQTQINS